MVDVENEKIISIIENMYFVSIQDLPLEMGKSICDLNRYKCTPHMLLIDEFSTYTNTIFGKDFLQDSKELNIEKN